MSDTRPAGGAAAASVRRDGATLMFAGPLERAAVHRSTTQIARSDPQPRVPQAAPVQRFQPP